MKRQYAEDIAATLFDWDFEDMSDFELYAALEEQGYEWDAELWAWVGDEVED